ncbi:Uncharacterised protein [Vibrio cholerae]|nr:Uncharacterised protein [Vibrio cholerae]CSI69402.1 Uncharacterised protein [Vibrio cholerae]
MPLGETTQPDAHVDAGCNRRCLAQRTAHGKCLTNGENAGQYCCSHAASPRRCSDRLQSCLKNRALVLVSPNSHEWRLSIGMVALRLSQQA